MKEKIENVNRRISSLKLKYKKCVERVRAIKKRLEVFAPLLKGQNLVYMAMGLIVVYGIIAQLLGWV